MELIMFMVMVVVLVLIFLLVLFKTRSSPKEMEAIPGTLGWPIVGESLSFISEFSSPAGIYSWSEVNNMPYTAKVISETLRMATILPWFSRKAAQDFEIEGCKIKKGWSLNLDVVSIHRDPKNFPNPEKFDPSRFDEPIKPFSFLGFGSGPRMCPGINLAKLEISVFLHHLVCRYKWTPLDTEDSVQPTLVRMLKNKYRA